jgi:hypothetical protein
VQIEINNMKKYIEVIKDGDRMLIDCNYISFISETSRPKDNCVIHLVDGKTYIVENTYLDVKHQLLK